jgi:hypothetical protein
MALSIKILDIHLNLIYKSKEEEMYPVNTGKIIKVIYDLL